MQRLISGCSVHLAMQLSSCSYISIESSACAGFTWLVCLVKSGQNQVRYWTGIDASCVCHVFSRQLD